MKAGQAPPFVELRFQVVLPIAGVKRGQILTVREWAGAWALERPLRPGERVLLFLYPESRLGFTSPVGGARGVVRLDSAGANALPPPYRREPTEVALRGQQSKAVSVIQLERAIRRAREP